LLKDLAISIQEDRAEIEELDLLGEVFSGEQNLEVVLLSGLGGAPREQPKRVRREPRLHEERRDRCDDQNGKRPDGELQQEPAVRD
jgi:hypothetical protein